MGWWSSLWGGQESDPLGKLDPGIKAYLERESPVKYHDLEPKSASSSSTRPKNPINSSQKSHSQFQFQFEAAQDEKGEEKPLVPPESLFQDGRYAHLWKTYVPLHDIEATNKSDNEKLSDILDGYKERKRRIASAAIENCSEEQLDWRHCMTDGSWGDRSIMCRNQVKKFERCYNVNSRLLKALGYASQLGRDAIIEEDIQVHAFDLYTTMLRQEKAIKKAREAGEPTPEFPPLFPGHSPEEEEQYIMTLPAKAREKLQAQLDAAGPVYSPNRAYALKLWKDEWVDRTKLVRQVESHWEMEEKKRQKRIAESGEKFSDKIRNMWRDHTGNHPVKREEKKDDRHE